MRTLAEKTADKSGNATWNWTLNDLNIDQGSWQIVVTAKLGDQSKTVADLQNLEVSQ